MMLEAVKGPRGEEMARCTCDDCGEAQDVRAAHGHHKGFKRGGYVTLDLGKPGQALKKIESMGWHSIAKKLFCPKCVETRRSKDPETMIKKSSTNVAQLAPREPTPKQKRDIIGMLEVCYDDGTKRYKGSDTDKTVAEALGDGILLGWVAAIREEFFGPDGGNSEIEATAAEIKKLIAAVENHEQKALSAAKSARDHAEAATKFGDQARSLVKRIEAIKQAVGPKAAGA